MMETMKPLFDRSNFKFTPCGEAIVKKFAKVRDEELGRDIVKEDGEIDIYEFIQASNSQTDLSMLREQMIRTGQLPQVDPTLEYGVDSSLMPTDIHSLYDIVGNAQNTFNDLPDNVRAAFGNDPKVFLNSLVDGSYSSVVANHLNKVAQAEYEAQKLKEKEGGDK